MKCIECEATFGFPADICLYWCGSDPHETPSYRAGKFVRVLTEQIWCGACNRLSYAERLPTLREFELAVGIRRLPDQSGVGEIDDELLHLNDEELFTLEKGLRERRQPGNCLWCGGHSYIRLDIRSGRVVNLRHESCGGQFQFRSFFSGASVGPRTVRWFEFSGRCLGVQQDVF
jgi:hypothetical protein